MEHLREHWGQLDDWTQHELARAWVLLRDEAGLNRLSLCVAETKSESSLCLTAVCAARHLPAIPAIRTIIRDSNDSELITIAAKILARVDDTASRDLILWALMETRGGWRTTETLLDTYGRFPPVWAEMYPALLVTMIDDPTARALVAARVLQTTYEAYRRPVREALEEALTRFWQANPLEEPERAAAEAAIRALQRSADGCHRLISHIPPQLTQKAHGAKVRLVLNEAPGCTFLPAFTTIADPISGGTPIAGNIANRPTMMASQRDNAASDAARWWTVTLDMIGDFSGLQLTTETRRFLAERIADAEAASPLPRRRWELSDIAGFIADAPKYRTADAETRLASYVARRLPSDFHGYQSPLRQPEWWPRNLHLTIDDGPQLRNLPLILDTLKSKHVKATFFFVGAALARRWLTRPQFTRTLVHRVVEEGHRIGFHSMNHITKPSQHLKSWDIDQVADSVRLFRAVLNHVADQTISITHGRLPGGMGYRLPWIEEAFFQAGLHEHVHWNAGPPSWVASTRPSEVQSLACGLARRRKPTVILLHENERLPAQLASFMKVIEHQCPSSSRDQRLHGVAARWRK